MLLRMTSALARRRWALVLAALVLIVQVLQLHVHTFSDHLVRYGHAHPAEVHISGMQTAAGDHEIVDEAPAANAALVKLALGGLEILPIIVALLLAAPPARRLPRPPEHPFARPTLDPPLRPPLRAPPR